MGENNEKQPERLSEDEQEVLRLIGQAENLLGTIPGRQDRLGYETMTALAKLYNKFAVPAGLGVPAIEHPKHIYVPEDIGWPEYLRHIANLTNPATAIPELLKGRAPAPYDEGEEILDYTIGYVADFAAKLRDVVTQARYIRFDDVVGGDMKTFAPSAESFLNEFIHIMNDSYLGAAQAIIDKVEQVVPLKGEPTKPLPEEDTGLVDVQDWNRDIPFTTWLTSDGAEEYLMMVNGKLRLDTGEIIDVPKWDTLAATVHLYSSWVQGAGEYNPVPIESFASVEAKRQWEQQLLNVMGRAKSEADNDPEVSGPSDIADLPMTEHAEVLWNLEEIIRDSRFAQRLTREDYMTRIQKVVQDKLAIHVGGNYDLAADEVMTYEEERQVIEITQAMTGELYDTLLRQAIFEDKDILELLTQRWLNEWVKTRYMETMGRLAAKPTIEFQTALKAKLTDIAAVLFPDTPQGEMAFSRFLQNYGPLLLSRVGEDDPKAWLESEVGERFLLGAVDEYKGGQFFMSSVKAFARSAYPEAFPRNDDGENDLDAFFFANAAALEALAGGLPLDQFATSEDGQATLTRYINTFLENKNEEGRTRAQELADKNLVYAMLRKADPDTFGDTPEGRRARIAFLTSNRSTMIVASAGMEFGVYLLSDEGKADINVMVGAFKEEYDPIAQRITDELRELLPVMFKEFGLEGERTLKELENFARSMGAILAERAGDLTSAREIIAENDNWIRKEYTSDFEAEPTPAEEQEAEMQALAQKLSGMYPKRWASAEHTAQFVATNFMMLKLRSTLGDYGDFEEYLDSEDFTSTITEELREDPYDFLPMQTKKVRDVLAKRWGLSPYEVELPNVQQVMDEYMQAWADYPDVLPFLFDDPEGMVGQLIPEQETYFDEQIKEARPDVTSIEVALSKLMPGASKNDLRLGIGTFQKASSDYDKAIYLGDYDGSLEDFIVEQGYSAKLMSNVLAVEGVKKQMVETARGLHETRVTLGLTQETWKPPTTSAETWQIVEGIALDPGGQALWKEIGARQWVAIEGAARGHAQFIADQARRSSDTLQNVLRQWGFTTGEATYVAPYLGNVWEEYAGRYSQPLDIIPTLPTQAPTIVPKTSFEMFLGEKGKQFFAELVPHVRAKQVFQKPLI